MPHHRQKNPRHMNDAELLSHARKLVHNERRLQRTQIEAFIEIHRRRLHLAAGHESLFMYMVKGLGLSKAAAAQRNSIARGAGRWPRLMDMLESGELNLATASYLAPNLAGLEDADGILDQAAGKSRDEIELLLAPTRPAALERDSIRTVGVLDFTPSGTRSAGAPSPEREAEPMPGAPPAPQVPPVRQPDPRQVVVKVSFATNQVVQKKLQRVRELMATKHPGGRLSDLLETMLDEYIERHDPQAKAERAQRRIEKREEQKGESLRGRRFGTEPLSPMKSAGSRYIPAEVKRVVWLRDGGRCTWVGPDGTRCTARSPLQYDHVINHAMGGPSRDPRYIRLLCRAHNLFKARQAYGDGKIDRASGVSPPA